MLTDNRIFEKNHLLDATEIFRKLNVHKKVSFRRRWRIEHGLKNCGVLTVFRNRSSSLVSTC